MRVRGQGDVMGAVPSWAWIAWGSLCLGSFVVLETLALVNAEDGDTLSENLRRWLGIYPESTVRQVAVPLFVAAIVVFVVWFVPHIVLTVQARQK